MLTQIAAYQQMISINLQNLLAAKWKQVTNHAWAQPSTSELSKIWYDIFKLSEMSNYSRLRCVIIKGNPKTLNLETGIWNPEPETRIQNPDIMYEWW